MDNNNNSSDPDSTSNLVFLHPNPEKCLDRVPSLSKVDGLEQNEIDILNKWFSDHWKKIYNSGFVMNEDLTGDFTDYLESNSSIAVDLDKAESYLEVQKLLYNGLRFENVEDSDNISQCKLFHRYYYSCRENPTALNNLVVLSNVIWSLKKYKRDEFALTCLVDVLLQSYMVALDSFISLGGVETLREIFEYLAQNERLKHSSNYLLKCMDLLDKLDINFKILQTSKIGVPVNCIALAKSHAKLKLDYECANDKVKLKATNLVKKWKAIRDASIPKKSSFDGDIKHKKGVVLPEKRLEKRAEKGLTDHSPINESEGSFVLNIINTIAEQKEREKKRKLEIRNSQMSSKYKSKSTEESEKVTPEKVNEDSQEDLQTKPSDMIKTPENKSDEATKSTETDEKDFRDYSSQESEKTDSNSNRLESLMNFFKEYSNKTEKPLNQKLPVDSHSEVGNVTKKEFSKFSDIPTKFTDPVNKYSESSEKHPESLNKFASPISRFASYPVMGQVLPPGFIPPPPPPPPVPPGFPLFSNVQVNTPTNSSQFITTQTGYNNEVQQTEKKINFFRSGTDTPKDTVEDVVVPPWK